MRFQIRKRWAAILSLSAVASLGASSCQTPDVVELTILNTNDMHLMLDRSKADPFELGGVARLRTKIKQMREQYPDSILMDAGDWSEGNWFFNVDGGANILRFMNRMGFDNTVLGNHDFLNGPDGIIDVIEAAKVDFKVVAANLDRSKYPNQKRLNKVLPPYVIIEKAGLKIGIIGLTTYEITYADYLKPLVLKNPVDTATEVAKELRPKVDVLLVNSHNSFGSNVEVAQLVPGVDAVISGHSHLKTPRAVVVKNAGQDVPIVETGSWMRFLGDLKLEVDRKNKTVRFKGYELHPVSPDLEEDAEMKEWVRDQYAALQRKTGRDPLQVIAETDIELRKEDTRESTLSNLAVKAFKEITGADASIDQVSLIGVELAAGAITYSDARNIMPHIYNLKTGREWGLHVWNARGKDLKLVVNVFYTLGGFGTLSGGIIHLSTAGMFVNWTPGVLPLSVNDVEVAGVKIDPEARYKIAITDGMLTAIRKVQSIVDLGVDLSQLTDTGIEAPVAIAEYLERHKRVTLDDVRLGRASATTGPDAALYYTNVSSSDDQITLLVENVGLQEARTLSVTCESGLPNNSVVYDSDQQVWREFARKTIDRIPARGSYQLTLPWERQRSDRGRVPLRCRVEQKDDGYLANNVAEWVHQTQ